jgi:hypothetical protein
MARVESSRPQVAAQLQQKTQAKLSASAAKELKPAVRDIKQSASTSSAKGTRVDIKA